MMIMMGVHMETNHESSLLFNTLLYAIYILYIYVYLYLEVLLYT